MASQEEKNRIWIEGAAPINADFHAEMDAAKVRYAEAQRRYSEEMDAACRKHQQRMSEFAAQMQARGLL